MIWLLLGWCHVKLLPSRRTFCIHHRVYNYARLSKRACWCSRHARIKGDDRADRLAGDATTPSGLHDDPVLRSLRNYLWAQSQGHYTIDRLEERGVERGSAQQSSVPERTRESQYHSDPTLARFQRHRWGKS